MASVYKSVSKTKTNGSARDEDADNKPKNRQRLLILSSRGVTYRLVSNANKLMVAEKTKERFILINFTVYIDIAICCPIYTPSSRTVEKTQNSTPRPNCIS
jgi:hypothetical protein